MIKIPTPSLKMVAIYQITSPSNKIYVGQSWDVEKRILKYKSINRSNGQPYLNRSFKKYGIENHVFEIVHELPNDIEQNILDRYEQIYMDAYRDCGVVLLNCREAGSKGKLSEETKKKIGIAGKGRIGHWAGRTFSDETKLKMSISRGKRDFSDEFKLKRKLFAKGNKVFLGKTHSGETKNKISESNKNNKSEARRINAIANFKKASEKNARPVIQYSKDGSLINEFISIKEAGASLNIMKQSISHACRGRYKTAGGFKWQYK